MAVCIAPDAVGAAAELKSAIGRLIVEESPARRLDELIAQARDGEPDRRGKAGTAGLLHAKGRLPAVRPTAK
jgi:hypothetical protein